jgi:esterase/lipase superfamily enzyme
MQPHPCRPILAALRRDRPDHQPILNPRFIPLGYSGAIPHRNMTIDPRMPVRADRRLFLSGATACAAAGLGGCLPDVMATGAVARPAVMPEGDAVIYALTNRKPAKGALKDPWFSHERQNQPRLARVAVSRPDGSYTGMVRAAWNGERQIKGVTLDQRPVADAMQGTVQGREALLYIHGYKESFQSAVLGAAELTDGIGFSGHPMVFSWPSRAALLDYGYDRESALFSRDSVEEALTALLSDGGVSKLHIVAHSMGTLLTVETLRQMFARHGDVFAGKLGAVVLASADIDIDLFANSLQRLRSIVPKITVISSTSDKALEVSRRLAGGVSRAGAATREELEKLGVRVVDATDHGGWAVINHDLFLTDIDVRQVVRRAIERAG